MGPLLPWVGWWATSIAAGRGALDVAARLIGRPLLADARSNDHERQWATPNRIALDLATMRLRVFGPGEGGATVIVVAPFALHAATTADFAPGHSVVEKLLAQGFRHVFVTEWRSAGPEQAHIGIDACLSDLNVAVDEIGAPAAIVGLCQGGWLSAAYAARFPRKVSVLALVGAPLDLEAAPSAITAFVKQTSPEAIAELVAIGEGVMLGTLSRSFWLAADPAQQEIARVLQTKAPSPDLQARFRAWNDDIVDLPGRFYVETTELIFRRNLLARGGFPALGKMISLADAECPMYLLAARDDEIVTPAQLLAVSARVPFLGRPIVGREVKGSHLGLFMGRRTLARAWPGVAEFLMTGANATIAPKRRSSGSHAPAYGISRER